MNEDSRRQPPGQPPGPPREPGANPGSEPDRALEALRAAWSRLEPAEPPELVDRQVLNAARRAVAPPARRWRWIGGFATAGVVVLTVSLVLLQEWRPAPPQPAAEQFELRQAPPAGAAKSAAEPAGAMLRDAAEADAAAPARRANEAMDTGAPAALQSAAPAREAADEAPPAPGEWIERLLRLRAEGQTAALARELAAFRAAYPDYPLPPELED